MQTTDHLQSEQAKLQAALLAAQDEETRAQKAAQQKRASKEAALREELDNVNERLRIETLKGTDAKAAAWEVKRLEMVDTLRQVEAERLEQVAQAEHHLRAAIAAIIAMFKTADRVREAASALAVHSGYRPSFLHMNQGEFVARTALRVAGLFASIPKHRYQLGCLNWPSGSLYPAERAGWREEEAVTFGHDIREAIAARPTP